MKLFVDNEFKGHHSEYLDIIIKYHQVNSKRLVLAVSQEYYNNRKDIHHVDNIVFVVLKKTLNLLDKFKEVKQIQEIAKEFSVNEICLLNFNYYFKLMFFFGKKYSISGIYFMPYLMKSNISKKEYRLKTIQFKSIFLFCNIKSIMILNDTDAVSKFNNLFKNNKFSYLVDPVYYLEEPSLSTSNREKLVLSFLGEVSPRKGIFQFLDALDNLEKEKLNKLEICIAGNSTVFKEEILVRIGVLEKKCPTLFGNVYLDRVEESVFNTILLKADIVLCLHQKVEGSSGIVGKASVFKKPIIGPKEGLIGCLIKKYGIGVQINTKDPLNISKAIENILEKRIQIEDHKFEHYVEDHSPDQFVKKLI
ncbi:glycosyltransferase [Polaribacter sp. Hel1_85]|uniref:glycosyltransferase n=1 Tax=Polaribacter sp. Hel1_85 TaxID=1250005 RepID=UPI00052DD4F1|nr:glycosyltransferase [Polaribacter sp. Hel1_85]KGL64354.1 glycosyltransferase, GT4 family [Polaribacter sp. Hel1_85]